MTENMLIELDVDAECGANEGNATIFGTEHRVNAIPLGWPSFLVVSKSEKGEEDIQDDVFSLRTRGIYTMVKPLDANAYVSGRTCDDVIETDANYTFPVQFYRVKADRLLEEALSQSFGIEIGNRREI